MKKCFRCEETKPLSDFYKHPAMGDGYLGKCKDCTKKEAEARRHLKMKDPEWANAEAERHRKKQAKYRKDGRATILTGEKKRAVNQRHAQKYPEKAKARMILGNSLRDGKVFKRPCEVCGSTDSEAHHDDYSKPLDVIWLCPKHHSERHVQMRNEQRVRMAAITA